MQLLWMHERVVLIRDEKLIVFHRRGESLVVSRKGNVLKLKNKKELPDEMKKLLKDYSSELPGDFSIQRNREETTTPIQFFYVDKALVCFINEKIDLASQAALGSLAPDPDVVILSNAPRFNLERLLKQIRPRIVVADGSNHKGFVSRCRSTCQALGIEFHETREKGAFLYPK
jgi:competence protein ComEC